MADRARRKRRRLSRSGEFERVYREGRSHASRHLVVYAFPRSDDETEPRALGTILGVLVGARERVQHEEAVALRATLAVDTLELGAPRQPAPLRAPPAARAPSH